MCLWATVLQQSFHGPCRWFGPSWRRTSVVSLTSKSKGWHNNNALHEDKDKGAFHRRLFLVPLSWKIKQNHVGTKKEFTLSEGLPAHDNTLRRAWTRQTLGNVGMLDYGGWRAVYVKFVWAKGNFVLMFLSHQPETPALLYMHLSWWTIAQIS